MMLQKCFNCTRLLPAEAQYCPRCGEMLRPPDDAEPEVILPPEPQRPGGVMKGLALSLLIVIGVSMLLAILFVILEG